MGLTKREGLNRPLTGLEVDNNFEYLHIDGWIPRDYSYGEYIVKYDSVSGLTILYRCLHNHTSNVYTYGFTTTAVINSVLTKIWEAIGGNTTGGGSLTSYSAYTGVTLDGSYLRFSGHTIPNQTIDLSNISGANIVSGSTYSGTGGTRNITIDIHTSDNNDTIIDLLNAFNFKNNSYVKRTIGGITSGIDKIDNLTIHEIFQKMFFPLIAPTINTYSSNTFSIITGSTTLTSTPYKVIAGATFGANVLKLKTTYNIGNASLITPATFFYMGTPKIYHFNFGSVVNITTSLSTYTYQYPITYVVSTGRTNNTFSSNITYNPSTTGLYYDDLTTNYINSTFTSSGSTAPAQAQIEGCYPIFATINNITTVDRLTQLYSMVDTLNLSGTSPGSSIIITLYAESGSNRQTINIPSCMVGSRTVKIYAKNPITNVYDIPHETSDYITSYLSKSITPYGSSPINVLYKQYKYNKPSIRGTQVVAITIV